MTNRTPQKKGRFLKLLRERGNATEAAKYAGISRGRAYAWRDEDPEFAAKWEEALEAGTDRLVEEAEKRALGGSDTLLMFLIKGRRPEYATERRMTTHQGEVKHKHEVELSPELKELVQDAIEQAHGTREV